MIAFIGMETSGQLRRRFQAMGIETYSCDVLPAEDGGEEMSYSPDGLPLGRHLVGDVFETLWIIWAKGLWPGLAVFHITCTYLTNSAAWAFNDPDYDRYPGVGYHQRVKPGTLANLAATTAWAIASRSVCSAISSKRGTTFAGYGNPTASATSTGALFAQSNRSIPQALHHRQNPSSSSGNNLFLPARFIRKRNDDQNHHQAGRRA